MASDQGTDPRVRKIKLGVAAGAVLLMVAGALMGGAPTALVIGLACLGLLQGLWRGAAELVGLVISTVVAVLIAPLLGRGLEGLIGGVTGAGGVLNRMISVAVVGVAIIVVGAAGISIMARKIVKKHPEWATWNSFAGAGLGLCEGVLLGMGLLWGLLALEPVAADQVSDGMGGTNPSAEHVVAFAAKTRGTTMGDIARATNPLEGARLISLANDFAAISRDEAAMDYFLHTRVMQEINGLDSVKQAQEHIKADAALSAMFKDQGVTPGTLRAVLESSTILDIFDKTPVVAELTPRIGAIEQAITEAKTKIAGWRPK